MSEDTIKIKYSIRTNKVGSDCEDVVEFDRETWELMSEREREEEMQAAAFEDIEWNFWEVEE